MLKNFSHVDNLPVLDLSTELARMLESGRISWSRDNQICLNTIPGKEDDYTLGSGSLIHDWNNHVVNIDENGNERIEVKELPRDQCREEQDFSVMCLAFKDSLFEVVYRALNERYRLGRVRIMKMKPKTCVSWHDDYGKRLHYPIKTQPGCFMIIENEFMHIPSQEWWMTNTWLKHTALNSSKEDRIHLVASIVADNVDRHI